MGCTSEFFKQQLVCNFDIAETVLLFLLPLIFIYLHTSYYLVICWYFRALQWRHNGQDGVSNHQPYDCLLSRLFGRKSKKTSKLPVTGLCEGNSQVTGEFPAQRASNAENVSIWWRHHGIRHESEGWGSSPRQVETFSVSKTWTLSQEHPFMCRKWVLLPAHS